MADTTKSDGKLDGELDGKPEWQIFSTVALMKNREILHLLPLPDNKVAIVSRSKVVMCDFKWSIDLWDLTKDHEKRLWTSNVEGLTYSKFSYAINQAYLDVFGDDLILIPKDDHLYFFDLATGKVKPRTPRGHRFRSLPSQKTSSCVLSSGRMAFYAKSSNDHKYTTVINPDGSSQRQDYIGQYNEFLVHDDSIYVTYMNRIWRLNFSPKGFFSVNTVVYENKEKHTMDKLYTVLPDGRFVYSDTDPSGTGHVKISPHRDASSDKPLIIKNTLSVQQVTCLPTGHIAICPKQTTYPVDLPWGAYPVKIWCPNTGKFCGKLLDGINATSLAVISDGRLVVSTGDHVIHVLSLPGSYTKGAK